MSSSRSTLGRGCSDRNVMIPSRTIAIEDLSCGLSVRSRHHHTAWSSKTTRPLAASTGWLTSTPSTVRMNQTPNGMPRASGPRTSRKNLTRSAGSSSVARTSSFRPRPVMVARPAARRLRTQWTSPPGGPHPTPARDLDDRQGGRARYARFPAADDDEPIEAHRNPSGQKGLEDRVEERDPPGDAGGADQIAHLRRSFLRRCFRVPHKGPARRRGRDRRLIESDPQGATSARSSRRSRSRSASTSISTILSAHCGAVRADRGHRSRADRRRVRGLRAARGRAGCVGGRGAAGDGGAARCGTRRVRDGVR
jgi:hypothetical protein